MLRCIIACQVDVKEYVPITETSEDDYDRLMDINAKGAFLVSRAVARLMKEQEPKTITLPRHGTRDLGRGSIVNVASAASHAVVPAKLPYCASKHALLGITRACGMSLYRLPRSGKATDSSFLSCSHGPKSFRHPCQPSQPSLGEDAHVRRGVQAGSANSRHCQENYPRRATHGTRRGCLGYPISLRPIFCLHAWDWAFDGCRDAARPGVCMSDLQRLEARNHRLVPSRSDSRSR